MKTRENSENSRIRRIRQIPRTHRTPRTRKESTAYFGGTYRNAPDRNGYDCQITVDGKQLRKRFGMLTQAKAWLEAQSKGIEIPELTKAQILEAYKAYKLVEERGRGKTLLQCLEYGLGKATVALPDLTLQNAVERFLMLSEGGITAYTLRDYRHYLNKLATHYSGKLVNEITREDLQDYGLVYKDKPQAYNHFVKNVKSFFAWLVREDIIPASPAERLNKVKTPPPKRQYLSIEQTKRLLEGTVEQSPELVPYIALGLFAGLRPTEATRLTGDDMNVATGIIRITPATSKTNHGRLIEMTPNLKAWLKSFPVADGERVTSLSTTPIAKRLRAIDKGYKVGLSQDVLRHTYATFKTALTQDSAKVALEMGHSESIAKLHYRGLATREEGQGYFSLYPPAEGKSKPLTKKFVGIPYFEIPMREF